jgi:hypothetical protein
VTTPISNNPAGLISLLGLNDLGGVPRFLETSIQTGIDITELLLIRQESISNTANFTAVGNAPMFTVPAGELWYIHKFGARSAALAAGDRFAMGVGYQAISTTFFVPCGDVARASHANEIAMASMNQAPFWAGPGAALLVQCTDFAVAAGTLNVGCSIARTVLRV